MITGIICFILGIIFTIVISAVMAGRRQPDLSIDDCEKCKTAMCEKCDLNQKYEIVKADNKCLEEIVRTLRNRVAQINGENSRLYCKLFYQNKIGIAR